MGIAVKKEQGLTLVELIVASAIVVVIGTVMITILSLNSRQAELSSCGVKMCMGYDIAVSSIGQKVRSSSHALRSADVCPPSYSTPCTVTTFYLYDPDCNRIGGYNITSARVLQEYDTTNGAWKDFKITETSTPVTVTADPASRFIISASRKIVGLDLNVFASFGKASDTFRSGKESFLCRNF